MGNSVSFVPCGANIDPTLTNADALPVKFLFNNLTIPVDSTAAAPNGGTEGQNAEAGVEDLINNMVGLPAMDAIVLSALTTTTGEQGYLTRRSYLARYAAIRSVPDMIAGWRMPGSRMGQWVADLRQSGGVAIGNTSKNPSYKEIMHALSIDRFNGIDDPTGGASPYAVKMMTDPSKIEMEKLDLSVFYLMQLRDYYELLERTALTLSVQVSVMADQQSMENVNSTAPMK